MARILFVGLHNAGRSQMSEALFNRAAAGRHEAITGRYPRGIFDFVEGVFRWHNRVVVYAFILITDDYPPFSLKALPDDAQAVGSQTPPDNAPPS